MRRQILVVPTYEDVVRYKKLIAATPLSFGLAVTTLRHFALDAWELVGDGRSWVTPLQRRLFLYQICEGYGRTYPKSRITATDGFLRILTEICSEGLVALKHYDELTESESHIVELAKLYRQKLDSLDLVEYCMVVDTLAQQEVLTDSQVVAIDVETTALEDKLVGSAKLSTIVLVGGFAERCDEAPQELQQLQTALFSPNPLCPVKAMGHVRLVLPAGIYAAYRMFAEELLGLIEANQGEVSLAIVSPHPYTLFTELLPRLDDKAILSVQTSIPFEATAFGKAWCALLDFIEDCDQASIAAASDFALSAFSGLSTQGAFVCDKRWREFRGQTTEDAILDLIGFTADGVEQFYALIEQGEYLDALDLCKQYVASRISWDDSFRAVQLTALEQATKALKEVIDCKAGQGCYRALLSTLSIPFVYSIDADSKASVTIMTLADLSHKEQNTYDVVLFEQLDAASFPFKDEKTAKDALFEKCGIAKPRDEFLHTRKLFARSIAAAKQQLIVSRCLRDTDGEENRPSVLFEELLDCYRSDLEQGTDLDESLELPHQLMPYAWSMGEEEVSANASIRRKKADVIMTDARSLSHVGVDNGDIVLPSKTHGEIVLSPSQIEAYHECPYRWFLKCRLDAGGIDAGFGPLEFGNFAHLVLERFHKQLAERGVPRVTRDTVQEATSLITQLFDQLYQEQLEWGPSEVLIVAQTKIEEVELQNLKRQLVDFISREADLLPEFHPAYHEVSFGKQDEPCQYAGVQLRGTIDRIDIDGFGNAVVIDYKGSTSKSFAYIQEKRAEGETQEFTLPRKLQSLIYAQIVRRRFGLNPQASLYLSYRKPDIQGAYDRRIFHPDKDLLGINEDYCAVSDFIDVLDRTEEALFPVLEDLMKGTIAPNPLDSSACEYCVMTSCEVRQKRFGGK